MTTATTTALSFTLLCIISLCSSESLRFLAVGDWGGQSEAPYTTQVQLQVADQMGKIASEFESQFTLGIGDNFYSFGIPTNVRDMRFQQTFENVYTASSLQTRWYMVAGNHDHLGNLTAELEYSKLSKRWYFPNPWYNEVLSLPGTSITVEFIFIDTIDLNDTLSGLKERDSSEQLQWIEESLQSSTADWIFVVGHYPVYSVAEHGPTPSLIQFLKPLMDEHNVAAYFCGHDHDLQHLHDDSSVVEYYLTGAGHLTEYSYLHLDDVPADSLRFYWPPEKYAGTSGGFITVEVLNEVFMIVKYYDDGGNVVYTHVKQNPKSLSVIS